MNHAELEQKVMENGERLTRVEQILPTLLTRRAFETAMVAVDRRFDELDRRFHGALAKHSEEIRRHFDVVSESLRSEIRIIAEGHGALAARLERVDRLESPPPSPAASTLAPPRKKSG